jgi:uroporphyrinogen decarboxylase
MHTNTRENTLRAITHRQPSFVPVFDGSVWEAFELGGNFESGSFTDHWGVKWQVSGAGLVPVDVSHPLADLDALDDYQWPDPWELTWTNEDQRRLDAVDRTKKLVGGCHINFLYERLRCLMGMENLLMAFHLYPDRLQFLIDRIVEYQEVCIRRLLNMGVDIIHVPEDLGSTHGLLMSPRTFRKFLMPAYERLFSPIHDAGVMIDFHTDGAIEEIIPDLISLGLAVLNPLEVTANDRHRASALLKDKVAVLGGINSKIVHRGTVQDVRAEVRRAFDVWKPGGGWLAGPDQVLTGAPEDNVQAFWDTCWELSDY